MDDDTPDPMLYTETEKPMMATEPLCECDQACCTFCDVHGDTGVVIDMEAHERVWTCYSVRDGIRQ